MEEELYINCEKFEEAMKKKGISSVFLYKTMGISRQSFSLKRKGLRPFTLKEMYMLIQMLDLNTIEQRDEIFSPLE